MAVSPVTGSEKRARSGAQTLMLLSAHRNCLVLRALVEGPKRQVELRRAAGSPAQTTLRAHLKSLQDAGAIVKHRRNAFPGSLEYELEKPGRELLSVMDVLESWLAEAPDGSIALGSDSGRAAVKALAESWSTAMLRALASRPLSLTELDRVIPDINYPSLERRLSSLRLAGLIEALPANGRGTPYTVSEWLRQGVGPLTSAIRWERRHLPQQTAGMARLDIEASFLLALPLLRLSDDFSGSCRMAMEMPNGSERRIAGVLAQVERGRVHSCSARLQGESSAWASGSTADWLGAIVEADTQRLELGGDYGLARAMVEGLHGKLFTSSSSSRFDTRKTD